jgi:hypothetical protein
VLKGQEQMLQVMFLLTLGSKMMVTSSGDKSLAIAKPDGPLFRSVYPSASSVRYMPPYSNVLSNKLRSKWESVSDVARALHFTLTARDNAPRGTAQTNTDEMTVNQRNNRTICNYLPKYR